MLCYYQVITFAVYTNVTIGLASNGGITSGLTDFFDTVIGAMTEVTERVQLISDTLTNFPASGIDPIDTPINNAQTGAAEATAEVVNVNEMIADARGIVLDQVDMYR